MRGLAEANNDVGYIKSATLIFLLRSVVLGAAMFRGPYFNFKKISSFNIFSVYLDMINIFQFVFILTVIQKKSLFRFVLYIVLLVYSLVFTFTMICYSRMAHAKCSDVNLLLGFALFYTYMGVLIFETVVCALMYISLRRDYEWTRFKKVGANPAINGRCLF